jgi:hypothetical protein
VPFQLLPRLRLPWPGLLFRIPLPLLCSVLDPNPTALLAWSLAPGSLMPLCCHSILGSLSVCFLALPRIWAEKGHLPWPKWAKHTGSIDIGQVWIPVLPYAMAGGPGRLCHHW